VHKKQLSQSATKPQAYTDNNRFYQHYQIITIQHSGFCDQVLVPASEKIRKVVVDAGDIAVADATDETGKVASSSNMTVLAQVNRGRVRNVPDDDR